MMGVVRRWYSIVLGGILLAGGVYIYLHRVELGLARPPLIDSDGTLTAGAGSSARANPNAASARPARIFWQKVDRSGEGFKLEMPTDTKEIQVPAYNGQGSTEQVEMIYAYPDADTSFSIAWSDNPPVLRASGESPNRTLDTARNDALAKTQTTLVSESRKDRGGFPTRDFVGRNSGGGIFNARLVLAGRRLYMLMASFRSDTARRPEDVARFFDSFTVTGAGH